MRRQARGRRDPTSSKYVAGVDATNGPGGRSDEHSLHHVPASPAAPLPADDRSAAKSISELRPPFDGSVTDRTRRLWILAYAPQTWAHYRAFCWFSIWVIIVARESGNVAAWLSQKYTVPHEVLTQFQFLPAAT